MKLKQGFLCLLAAGLFLMPLSAGAADKLITGRGLPGDYTEVKTQKEVSGPTLIFSDSPEMVYKNGVLYRDTVSGDIRIFFHHVNAMETGKKLAVLITNSQLRPVKYSIKNNSVGNASWDYLKAGKETQQKYFAGTGSKSEGGLGFGHSLELLTGAGYMLEPGQLLTGMIDFHSSGPVQVSVIMCDEKTDAELYNEYAGVQPMDEHPLRGTFAGADWQYTIKRAISAKGSKAYMLEMASNEEGYAEGIDGTTGLDALNYGNYGVVYKVNFKIKGDSTALYLNPIGGLFAGYAVLKNGKDCQLLPLPQDNVAVGGKYDDLLKITDLKAGEYSFIWSPPGASNLPVRLYWMQDGSI